MAVRGALTGRDPVGQHVQLPPRPRRAAGPPCGRARRRGPPTAVGQPALAAGQPGEQDGPGRFRGGHPVQRGPRGVRPVHGQREGGQPPRRRAQQAQRGRAVPRSPQPRRLGRRHRRTAARGVACGAARARPSSRERTGSAVTCRDMTDVARMSTRGDTRQAAGDQRTGHQNGLGGPPGWRAGRNATSRRRMIARRPDAHARRRRCAHPSRTCSARGPTSSRPRR